MIFAAVISLACLGQVLLPGSNLRLEEAQAKARLIVVAKPVGGGVLGSGQLSFGAMDLKPSAILKGEAKQEVLMGAGFQTSGRGSLPKDEPYIYFLDDFQGHPNILKMLPPSDENLAAVRKAIKAGEKP